MAKAAISRALKRVERDAAHITEGLRNFEQNAKVFSSDAPRMIDRYENRWVAVYRSEVAASDRTFSGLRRKIERKGIPLSETVIRHIDKEPKTFIFYAPRMTRGRFGNTTGRPYVAGHIIIPSVNVRGVVSFLLDTGADTTVLMPTDAVRLGVDFSRLSRTAICYGIGGKSRDYVTPAVFVIADGSTLHAY